MTPADNLERDRIIHNRAHNIGFNAERRQSCGDVERGDGDGGGGNFCRARGGFAIDNSLIYATGGLAVAQIKAYDAGFSSTAGQSGSATRLGWTVGAGVEQKLDAHWSVKAEYLYTSFARATYFPLSGFLPEKVDLSANIVRVGVNYKF